MLVIARQLLAALSYLHDQGIAHRDIKPDNLVIGPDSVPVLVDFGLAAPIDSDVTSRSGTLGTVAPEVLDGTFDPRRADLFALGTTLLAATTGQAPHAMWSVDARALRAAIEAVDADLRPLLLGLTQTSKAARFQSAQEALQVLERVSRVPLGSARTWPLVGRTAEISAIVEHFRSVDTATSSRRSVVLVGGIGSGRRALASAAAKRLLATTRRAVLIEAVLSVQDLAKVVGEPRTILTTSDPTVPCHLAAILGDEAVLTIEVSALSEAAVADLTRWLAVPAEVDPASVYRASAGVAEALRADLTGAKDDRVIDPAESWIALRGAAVEGASLSRSVEEMLVDAAMRGCVDLDRDGSYRLRSPSRRLSVLQATPREELRSLHAEAAMNGDPWHRALSGDGSEGVLDLGLAQLEEQADVDEVAVSVEHALRMLGSEALTRDAFTSIARRLIGAGKLDLVLRVF
ncbi:MAG TPA: protein kinase, partial [Planctomycetota bacterium]|nr:protein kinase [Planctomycetota bacterium]